MKTTIAACIALLVGLALGIILTDLQFHFYPPQTVDYGTAWNLDTCMSAMKDMEVADGVYFARMAQENADLQALLKK